MKNNPRSPSTHVRPARVTDVPRLAEMIQALADFHGEGESCRMTWPILRIQLFGTDPTLRAHVAERDGRITGMVLWYRTYSTWDAAPGIHVEDFYVDPEARGQGTGLILMTELARLAVDQGYTRLEGQVISSNPLRSALVSHGGDQMDVWETYRIDGDELLALTGREPAAAAM